MLWIVTAGLGIASFCDQSGFIKAWTTLLDQLSALQNVTCLHVCSIHYISCIHVCFLFHLMLRVNF